MLLVFFHRPGCGRTEGVSHIVEYHIQIVYPVLASDFFTSSCNSRQPSQSLVPVWMLQQ